MRELLRRTRGHHLESQVVALRPAVEDLELDADFFAEVAQDVLDDRRLCRGGQADDGRRRFGGGALPDEPAHVAVVRPEVVAPARQAVGFVEHPGADLALLDGFHHPPVAELLGRSQDDPRIAQPDAVEGVRAFRHGQHAVDGDHGPDAPVLQSGHLVRHEGDQGRNDDGQRPRLVVARQGRHLVAQRLAAAGRQEPQDVPARHRLLDDGALHRSAVGQGRFGAEVVETEPAPEFGAGVVHFAAPSAVAGRTGAVAQLGEQLARFGKLVSYPGRHHRVAAGHGQPGQHVGQGPARFARARDDGAAPGGASLPRRADGRWRPSRLCPRAEARSATPRTGHRTPQGRHPATSTSARRAAGRRRPCRVRCVRLRRASARAGRRAPDRFAVRGPGRHPGSA